MSRSGSTLGARLRRHVARIGGERALDARRGTRVADRAAGAGRIQLAPAGRTGHRSAPLPMRRRRAGQARHQRVPADRERPTQEREARSPTARRGRPASTAGRLGPRSGFSSLLRIALLSSFRPLVVIIRDALARDQASNASSARSRRAGAARRPSSCGRGSSVRPRAPRRCGSCCRRTRGSASDVAPLELLARRLQRAVRGLGRGLLRVARERARPAGRRERRRQVPQLDPLARAS